MDSLLYRAARGSASTARAGGIRVAVRKVNLLRPRGRIVDASAEKTDDDWTWHDAQWISERVAEVVEETARLTALGKCSDEKINDFCADHDHAFTQGVEPYLAVRVALWDALHMDNNLVGSTVQRYVDLARDMDAHFEGGGYLQRLFTALRACGARIGRHVVKIQAGEDFRIAGDDAIDIFLNSYLLDDALRLMPPHADKKQFWWLQRAMLTTRLRVHRALSYYQVRYTLNLSDVDDMIALGELYQFVHKHTGMGFTYSDFYLSKVRIR